MWIKFAGWDSARVKAHIAIHERLKSGNTPVHHQIVVKDLVIDTDAHRVNVRGKEVSLKNKEYELLVFLASNPDTDKVSIYFKSTR